MTRRSRPSIRRRSSLGSREVDRRRLWLERGSTLALRGDLPEAIAAFRTGLLQEGR